MVDRAGGPGQFVGSCQATSGLGALSWVPMGGWCWSVPGEPALLLGWSYSS